MYGLFEYICLYFSVDVPDFLKISATPTMTEHKAKPCRHCAVD